MKKRAKKLSTRRCNYCGKALQRGTGFGARLPTEDGTHLFCGRECWQALMLVWTGERCGL